MPKDPHESLANRYQQSLTPAPPAIDPQSLWFEAGRASVRPRSKGVLLKAYSGVMTATAASLALVVIAQQRSDVGMAETGMPEARMPEAGVAGTHRPLPPKNIAGAPEPQEPARLVDQTQPAGPGAFRTGTSPPPEASTTPGLWAALFPPREVDPDSYLARRERALRGDLEPRSSSFTRVEFEIDDRPFEPSPPATRRHLLEEYLPNRNRLTPPRPAADPRTESTLSNAKELV